VCAARIVSSADELSRWRKKKRNQTGVCVVAVAVEEDVLMSFHIFEF
jgi:hypothetical protein